MAGQKLHHTRAASSDANDSLSDVYYKVFCVFLFSEKSVLEKFLSLGVAASVAIIVGGLIVFIVCVAAVVCCCRRCCCKPDLSNSGTASAPSSLVANGNPTLLHGNGNAQQDRGMPSFSALTSIIIITIPA